MSAKSAPHYPLGATYLGEGRCAFLVWAPKADRVELELGNPAKTPVEMRPFGDGYFGVVAEGAPPGTRYMYRLDGKVARPDPASRFQPEGVHGPAAVIDPEFPWRDAAWHGIPLRDYILYELHVGTFTPEGTFDAVIPRLDALVQLGITVVELMPVAQFPGGRNWGYDGVYPFAVQSSYGGPDGLRRLVDACHERGLAVALDVVYNHLGPEGNYFADFGHYFTDRYRTPWGQAINFDDQHSDHVRRYFVENALHWITDFHIDSLRLDAVHAIFDESARPFLRELGQAVHQRAERLNRRVTVIAESNKNDARQIEAVEIGGYGLDGVWADDFHHALHVALTGERDGYYEDFHGVPCLAKSLQEGFVYTGQYAPFRARRHGVPAAHLPPERFVVCAQNHDQVGNRARGERLTALVDFDSLKLAAAALLLSPGVPLLFMGEEYGETAPFLFFVSHSDPDLIEAVRRGRRREFASFSWTDDVPDPQAEETFRRSRLDWKQLDNPQQTVLRDWYRELIRLRKSTSALCTPERERMEVVVSAAQRGLLVRSWHAEGEWAIVFNFGKQPLAWSAPLPTGQWRTRLDSVDERWRGPGGGIAAEVRSDGEATLSLSPRQVVVLERGVDA